MPSSAQCALLPDESLLALVASGDKQAFEALVHRHHRRFYQMCYRWLLHREDAEDVVQQSFLKLWTGKARWKPGKNAKFTTWFYTILYHASMDVLRRQPGKFDTLSEQLPAQTPPPDMLSIDRQEQQIVRQALLGLSDRQRVAVQDGQILGLVANRILVQAEGAEIETMLGVLAGIDFDALGSFGQ